MMSNFKLIRNLSSVLLLGALTVLSGCFGIGFLDYDSSGILAKSRLLTTQPNLDYGPTGSTPVDIPAGAAVGNMILPNFRTTTGRWSGMLGVSPATLKIANVLNSGVAEGLPDYGVPGELSADAMFSYMKIATVLCDARMEADRSQKDPAAVVLLGNLRIARTEALLSERNTAAAWESYYNNLANRFWGRSVRPAEVAVLNRLRDRSYQAAQRTPAAEGTVYAAALSICVATAVSLDGLTY
jgi:hypothetical protein